MKQDKKVSIIIPVYNGENTISRAIEACLKQTYQNIEIIIVDDGSYDKTENICRSYAVQHLQLMYYKQENRGAAAARNLGLDVAQGHYIVFCDADDEILPQYVERLVCIYEEQPCDLAGCSYRKIFCKKANGSSANKKNVIKKFNQDTALESFFYRKEIMGYPYCKLFPRYVIGDSRFKTDYKLAEDFIFCYEILEKCKNISVTNEELYFYYQTRTSVTHMLESYDMKKWWYTLYNISQENKMKCNIYKAIQSMLFIKSVDYLTQLKKDCEDSEFKETLLAYAKAHAWDVFQNHKCSYICRLVAIAVYINVYAAVVVLKVAKKYNSKFGIIKKAI